MSFKNQIKNKPGRHLKWNKGNPNIRTRYLYANAARNGLKMEKQPSLKGKRVSFALWPEFGMSRRTNCTVIRDYDVAIKQRKKGMIIRVGAVVLRDLYDCVFTKPYTAKDRIKGW